MLHRYNNSLNFKADAPVGYRLLRISRASLCPENLVRRRDCVGDSYAVGECAVLSQTKFPAVVGIVAVRNCGVAVSLIAAPREG